MDTGSIKKDIIDHLEHLTEEQLHAVHEFISGLTASPDAEWNLEQFIKGISEERKEVLQKLAQ